MNRRSMIFGVVALAAAIPFARAADMRPVVSCNGTGIPTRAKRPPPCPLRPKAKK